ncbi:MAG: hypothetical protein JW966_08160 [Anaerolineae bacterium]|nr:hypothetical protein [Anaerolineae bacterium]
MVSNAAQRPPRRSYDEDYDYGYDNPPPAGTGGPFGWSNYSSLRRRARFDSMAWWQLKTIQGALLGGGPLVFGLLLWTIAWLTGAESWLRLLGLGIGIVGALVALRYLAAPLTCRWIVSVPENWYAVVEDSDGYTLEYLEPGRMIVPWRWGSVIRRYVDFNSIVVNDLVEDVLDSQSLPVDIDVSLLMAFNPVSADPPMYAALRQMTTPEQFQAMIARDVRDIVRKHLNTLAPVQGQSMLHNVESLETVITEQIAGRAAMGLTPASTRPVTVHVRAPQKVKEAYQSLWARAARVREESQTLMDIKELARDLGLPFNEAFQLFYIMQRGAPPSRRTTRRAQQALDEPPVVVFQTTAPRDIDKPVEAAALPAAALPLETSEPGPPAGEIEKPAAADGPSLISDGTSHIIEDPQRAPDPFDLRRQRKSRRRSDQ